MYLGTSHVVLGSGLTVASAVACLSFTRLPYFQSLGPARGDRHPRRAGCLAHAGPGRADDCQSFRPLRSQASVADPRLASNRYRHCPLARTDSRRRDPPSPQRPTALPGYKTSYDTLPYIPATSCGQRRIHRRRTALLPRPVGARTADDRGRPRLAEIRPTCSCWTRWPRASCTYPVLLRCSPSTGTGGPPLDHSSIAFQISQQSVGQVQNLKYQMDRARGLGKAVRRVEQTIGILQQQYTLQQATRFSHARRDPEIPRTLAIISECARQARELRRLLPAAAQLLLLGEALLRHPGMFRPAETPSKQSTASTSSPRSSKT